MTPNSLLALKPKNQRGLTLIEVMIAIALFAFISMAIYQVTTSSFKVNFSLGNESNDYMGIVLSIQALESDLSQIYTPLITSESKPDGNEQPSDFWGIQARPDGMRRSRLTGTREKITFVANNNRRVERDSPQSDFLKITWEIEQNKSGAYSLYRTTDWDAFRTEPTTNSRNKPVRVALLENITSAKFSYYRASKKAWEDTWESEGPYVKPEERYPDLISLKFEAPDPTNNAAQQPWEVIVKPNTPLNYIDPKKKAEQKNAGFLE